MNNCSIVALTLSLFFATCGCGSSSSPPGNANTGTVTFTNVYSDILSEACVPCHTPGSVGYTAGGMDVSTQAVAYANLQKSASGASCKTSALKLVVPGDAAMSLLVEKVESPTPPCGAQMPYGCPGTGLCLSAAQVREIVEWVNDGAQND